MVVRTLAVFCLVAVPASGALPAAAAQQGAPEFLYVSTTGDDRDAGTTEATALRTLRRALRRAGPGTTVRVLPGRYEQSTRAFSVRGLPEAPIRIVGESGRAVFHGRGEERWGLWLEEGSHVELERLVFRDFTDIGVVVLESDHVTLRRLVVRNNGFEPRAGWVEGYGVHLEESSDLLVESNRVFRNGPDPRPWNVAGTGINGYRMTRAVIRKNRSFENHGGGILVEDSVDVLVKRNKIWENDLDVSADDWWDAGIWVDGGHDVRLIGNRIRDNLGPGIEISDEDCQGPTGYVLRRNRSIGNYFGIYVWNFGTTTLPGPPVLEARGNVFEDSSRRDVWVEAWSLAC